MERQSDIGRGINLVVLGAGSRGTSYARIATGKFGARVVAVVDPDLTRRDVFARTFGVPESACFDDWPELLAAPVPADAVVIATPDRLHEAPAIAFADKGYDILLEKPLAPKEDAARRMVEAAERNNVMMVVCHVMRYSSYTRALKAILDSGRIGRIVSVEHLEPIGWWHFAHSYVRGNWAREADSSSMLLAKASHDADWLMHIVGRPVSKVSSFGGLYHFKPENRPANAAERCLDCPLIDTCAYSAPKIYRRFLGDPLGERWPLAVLTPDVTEESVMEALRTGPYGRCVYSGDNDVADHQVVNLEFDDGATASMTVSAFTPLDFRKTRIMGTLGMITGDGRSLLIDDFVTAASETLDTTRPGGASAADGHGGADDELVSVFLQALHARRAAGTDGVAVDSGAQVSFASHRLVWAAEEARKAGVVVSLSE
ncbi:Gfo/Idh/MocA family oxidoreductase [Pseudarthrobacter sp. J64]|uniref:Gfo/Idh/MocA family protein n=1 Tax=Pseudarthrobacter sp. J64 TaxID=3116485 RepID=UPI002E806486|nr:Gfo/Idh/MocA family oxidoreductase [Pseudarthrobacter sp. J64]MEE2568914.1 Gfo/Idh/MocA family oxidoreductase [Pseudarthrobacter sp. J64]